MAKFETTVDPMALTATTVYPLQTAEFDPDEGLSLEEAECEGCGTVYRGEDLEIPFWCDLCLFGAPDAQQDPVEDPKPTKAQVDGLAGFLRNMRSGETF